MYRALIEVLGTSSVAFVKPSHAGQATAELAASYKKLPGEVRRNIDVVLDSVEYGRKRGSFARMSHASRRVLIRESRLDDRKLPGPLSRGFLVQQALAMAAAPFYPRDFKWDPVDIVV